MKKINSQIRHMLTFFAGIGTYFLGLNLIDAESAEQLNAAGKELTEPLVIFASAVVVVVSRAAMSWLGQRVPALKNLFAVVSDSDDEKRPSGGSGTLPLGIILVGAISLLSLPCCSGVSVAYGDAQGGLIFDAEGKARGFFRVPKAVPAQGGEIQASK